MPIYEYICKDCNHQFDTLRSMSDADKPTPCHKCNGEHTTRQLSVFFAQSGSRNIAMDSRNGGCASCTSSSCATCR